jgi:hypothetical protein
MITPLGSSFTLAGVLSDNPGSACPDLDDDYGIDPDLQDLDYFQELIEMQ